MRTLIYVIVLLAVGVSSGAILREDFGRQQAHVNSSVVIEPETHITNGLTAKTNQFNFQVGLSIWMSLLTIQWCGGSLITSEYILTAAHCTEGAKSIKAYLGSNQRRMGTKVKVLEIIIHSGWDRKEAVNDISILKIAPVDLGTSINVIKLPTLSSSNAYPNFLNEKGIASGWGLINDEGRTSKDLQYAFLQIVPNSVCSESLGSSITTSNICAKGQMGTSTCSGDSGGPLITENSEILIGITSFGTSKCTAGSPTAFTRITSYRSWIFEQIGI